MSNIIFSGDAIENFGKFHPNIYIDRVVVRNVNPDEVFLDISYAMMFHVTDEFDKEDIIRLLNDVNFYFAVSNNKNDGEQLLTKEKLIDAVRRKFILYGDFMPSSGVDDVPTTMFYPFSKENIIQNLNDNLYTDDVYDSEDRQVLIVNAEETIIYKTKQKTQSHIYLYAYTSLYDPDGIKELNQEDNHPDLVYDLSISDVSFEKIFSPNLNILTEIIEVYIDKQEQKYSKVPILSLNGVYYKTETVTRELIIEKVNSLTKRFTSKLNAGPLSEMIDSINYVIDQYGATEKLLVQLDRARKSFPNKTNNNRLGNLYAALSRLLLNINSAFLDGEIVTKQRIITGKVIDRREEPRLTDNVPSFSETSPAIPPDGFLLERNRISAGVEDDLSANSGYFFFRFEDTLKNKSKLSKLLDIEKLLDFPLPSLQEELKQILFSFFKMHTVGMKKIDDTGAQDLMSFIEIKYRVEDRVIAEGIRAKVSPHGELSDTKYNKRAELSEKIFFDQGENPEVMLMFEFLDLDRYAAVYEVNENETYGGMRFKYEIEVKVDDKTITMADFIEELGRTAVSLLTDYYDLASEICSYNNIQNRFNNFFVEKINELYPPGVPAPWEESVFMYSLILYVLTDNFESIQDVQKFSRNLIKSISPETGTLDSILNLLREVESVNDELFSSGSPYSNRKAELLATDDIATYNQEIETTIYSQDQPQLQTEAEKEIQSILDLFDFSGAWVRRYDSNGVEPINSEGGNLSVGVDESTDGSASIATMSAVNYSEGEYFDQFINSQLEIIFEETRFALEYIQRTYGEEPGLYPQGIDYVLSYNLYDAVNAGYGRTSGEYNYYLHTDYFPSGQLGRAMHDAVVQTFSRWAGTAMHKAKLRRDEALLEDGGLKRLFDFDSSPGFEAREVLLNDLQTNLTEAFFVIFQQALSRDTQVDSSRVSSSSRIREMVYVYVSDEGKDAITNFVNNMYVYYRDNMHLLVGSFPAYRLSSLYGTSTFDESRRATRDYYESIEDPITPLPEFVTERLGYEPNYNGPKLEDIPDLEYFDFELDID